MAALEEAKRLGITSVQDITFRMLLDAFQKVKNEGKLNLQNYLRAGQFLIIKIMLKKIFRLVMAMII